MEQKNRRNDEEGEEADAASTDMAGMHPSPLSLDVDQGQDEEWDLDDADADVDEDGNDGTVTSTMRRAANPFGCARCGAGADCSAAKYQSL